MREEGGWLERRACINKGRDRVRKCLGCVRGNRGCVGGASLRQSREWLG